jgi:hypothetical protein
MPKHFGRNVDAATVEKAAEDIAKSTDAGAIDTSLTGIPASGNTSIPAEQYKGVSPDIIPSVDRTEGFSSAAASNPTKFDSSAAPVKVARGAKAIDLANLDESNMMDLPFIEAKSYEIAAMLDIKLKDPAFRPRWVNFKNNEGGNYQMFKAIGFENAAVEDVDQDKTPLGENILKDDHTIKFYDVILMKVNTLRLMQAYKANVVKSLNMVGRWSDAAIKEAKRTFNNEVSPDIIAAMKQQGLSVDFYIPDKNEFRVRNAKGDLVEAE